MQEGDKTIAIVCGECDQNPCICPWDNPPVEEERERPESVAGKIIREGEKFIEGHAEPERGRPVEERPAGFGSEGGVRMSTYPRDYLREFELLQLHVRNHELSLLGIKKQLVGFVKMETDILERLEEIEEHLEALDKHKVDLADFEDHKNPTKHPY